MDDTCTIEYLKNHKNLMEQMTSNKIDDSPALSLNETSAMNADSALTSNKIDESSAFSLNETSAMNADSALMEVSYEQKKKSYSDESLNMDLSHDSSIETLNEPPLGGFYDLSEMEKFTDLTANDVQLPEISSTENVKANFESEVLPDSNLSKDTIFPKKPSTISTEIVDQQIEIRHEENNEENNSQCSDMETVNNLKPSESSALSTDDSITLNYGLSSDTEEFFGFGAEVNSPLGKEDFFGFTAEEIKQSSEKLNKNVKKPEIYHFPNVYRESTIISIPDCESESISYLRRSLPNQVNLELTPIGKNVIKPSLFQKEKYLKSSGYTKLDSLMKACSINDSNKKKKKSAKERNSIIKETKLLLIEKNVEIFEDNGKKSSIRRKRKRSPLKDTNQPVQPDVTEMPPKSNQRKRPRKLAVSDTEKYGLKNVCIRLERLPIFKEYAHLDYLDFALGADPPVSPKKEKSSRSKKEISFASRRSERLRRSEIKGIFARKSHLKPLNRRVSFSNCVLEYQY